MRKLLYRPYIDGLRAIAILLVVSFHGFPNLVKSGFIGVDIFFVISGYLISTIIISNLEFNRFSFIEFYSRRINRIFPALILVLISCLTFGWFALLPDEYTQLGKHIAGGSGFITNFLLWNESGYFDNIAETKPLLHLWSLAIEEQFYIFWPLLLFIVWKLRFNILSIIIIIGVISFLINISQVTNDSISAFYSPLTRFWELLVGSILAYLTLHKRLINVILEKLKFLKFPIVNRILLADILSFIGISLITIGIFLITKEKYFPGWWALLPTFGSFFIISAGSQAWFNRVILSNKVLVWFGLISFPLYLWHWPLLAFAHIIENETPSIEIKIVIILISIILSWLTLILIERPIRFGKYNKMKIMSLLISGHLLKPLKK